MDDTRASKEAASATRKRRSSILKNQRASRVPFSELEFNVTTPTDTTKSRRVSFSKRTGVAEFITNEATTTWKNFYEEHNKSFESSGNESAANAPRQTIDHIGKQLFDQQFEEVEIVDLGGPMFDNPRQDFYMSINNGNFTQQLAALELTNDIVRVQKFEQSSITDHQSKLFSDDLSVPGIRDVSNPILVNFSVMQPVESDKCDDLDEIQKDIDRAKNNMCHGPVRNVWEQSEYIKIDLDKTHVGLQNEESDMSITDTISEKLHSNNAPAKVVSNSKVHLNLNDDKENIAINPYVDDEENDVINPYVTPKESINFAINEIPDQVLVFDGKRLKLQSDQEALPDSDVQSEQLRKTKPHKDENNIPIRKTITLNVNDDLPNFVSNNILSTHIKPICDENKIMAQDQNVAIEQSDIISLPRRNTIMFEDDMGDISLTRCVTAKIVRNNQEKNKINDDNTNTKNTIIFDTDNTVSITQANFINNASKYTQNCTLYKEDNISITEAVPDIVLKLNETRKSHTIKYEENKPTDQENSKSNANSVKRKTILFENDDCNMSLTQAIPKNIHLSFNSNTEVVNKFKVPEEDVRKSILLKDDSCNMSITQVVPKNILLSHITGMEQMNKSQTKSLKFQDNDICDMSFTQAISKDIYLSHTSELEKMNKSENIPLKFHDDSHKTNLLENDICDMSLTQAIPKNIHYSHNTGVENMNISRNKSINLQDSSQKTKLHENDLCDMSLTQAIPKNIYLSHIPDTENLSMPENKSKIMNDGSKKSNLLVGEYNMSLTQAVLRNINLSYVSDTNNKSKCKDVNSEISLKAILGENDTYDMSSTQAITENIDLPCISDIKNLNKPENKDKNSENSNNQDIEICNVPKDKLMINGTVDIITENIDLPCISDIKNLNKPENKDKNSENSNNQDLEICNIPKDIFMINGTVEIINNKSNVCTVENNRRTIDHAKNAADSHSKVSKREKIITDMTVTCPLPTNLHISDIQVKVLSSSKQINIFSQNNPLCSSQNIKDIPIEDALVKEKITDIETKPILNEIVHINNETPKSKNKLIVNSNLSKNNATEVVQDILIYQVEATNISIHDKLELKTPFNFSSGSKQSNTQDAEIKPEEVGDKKGSDDSLITVSTVSESSKVSNQLLKTYVVDDNKSVTEQSTKKNESTTENASVPLTVKDICVDIETEPKVLILNNLLDMSSESINCVHVRNSTVYDVNAVMGLRNDSKVNSKDSLFLITDDIDNKIEDDVKNDLISDKNYSDSIKTIGTIKNDSLMPKFKDSTIFNDLENKLDFHVNKLSEEKNTNIQISVTTSIKGNDGHDKSLKESFEPSISKSFNDADDTGELLEMISGLTDRVSGEALNGSDEKIALENKLSNKDESLPHEVQRPSFIPQRRSIVMSREDLLNNISIAKAALQQSQYVSDESELLEESTKSFENMEIDSPPKTVRVSNEVVKTLKFEDESISDPETPTEDKISILNKTAYEETTYIKENKAKVIPTYLKDVSDNLKLLMNDLTKPVPDVMPFEGAVPKTECKTPSVCNIEVQANLVTSSQIDINEKHLDKQILCNLNDQKSIHTEIAHDDFQSTLDQDMNNVSKPIINFGKANEMLNDATSPQKKTPDVVLVFDHNNPLNNVILSPDLANVHKSSPDKSVPLLSVNTESKETGNHLSDGNTENTDTQSILSNVSKPISIDRSTEGITTEMQNMEANTLITMKGTKELLESYSSLTLVDDAVATSSVDINMKLNKVDITNSKPKSPVHVIYKTDSKSGLDITTSEFASIEEESDVQESIKPQKRAYRPQTNCSTGDITPKPLSKMKKLTNSPIVKKILRHSQDRHLEDSNTDSDLDHPETIKPRNKGRNEKNVTVQQLMIQYNMSEDEDMLDEKLENDDSVELDAISTSREEINDLETLLSCKSSKNSQVISCIGSDVSRAEWQAELVTDLSSKNLENECDPRSNVVAKINTLHFMGRDCEWEWSRGDSWSFRLLRGRLRLSTRLEHKHHNAPRSRVTADTPVINVQVQVINSEEKDPLAELCIRLAKDSMLYECSRGSGVTRAGDFPLLLRRCAGISRLALQWARAMHDAKARLAYTVSPRGNIVLKVANIPLRSVWEVTFNITLVEEEGDICWPKASDLNVTAVLADNVPTTRLKRIADSIPKDWGHAPRMIWRVFKYLKTKTRDDDIFSL